LDPSSTLKQLQLIPIFSEHMALSWSGISPTTTWGWIRQNPTGEIHGLMGNIHGKIHRKPQETIEFLMVSMPQQTDFCFVSLKPIVAVQHILVISCIINPEKITAQSSAPNCG